MNDSSVTASSFPGVSKKSKALRQRQWIVLTVLFVGGAIAFMDRTALSISATLVRRDLGLSMTEMGVLLAALSWSYGAVQIPFGALADIVRPRIMLSVCLAFWSAVQAFFGFASTFHQFLVCRLLLGVGEGPQFTSSALATRDWFNFRERGFTTGVYVSSTTIGPAVSAPLLSALMLAMGWRSMFILIGAAGCVVALITYLVYRNPQQVQLSAEDRAHLAEEDASLEQREGLTVGSWKRLFGCATTWGMCVGWFGVLYGVWMYLGWLPVYLEMERHMTIANTGWVAAIPFLCGGAGSLISGRVMDWLVTRGVSPLNSRRYPLAFSLIATTALTLVVSTAKSDVVAVGCVAASMFLLIAATAAVYATPPIVVPARYTGALAGIQNVAQLAGSSLPQLLTGYIVHRTGSFQLALWISASVTLVSGIVYMLMVRRPITEDDLEGRRERVLAS